MAGSKKIEQQLSIRAYAEMVGVDEKAVRKARDAGLLKTGYDAKTGKIIPSKADKAWGNAKKVIKPQAGISRAKAIEKLDKVAASLQPSQQPDNNAPDELENENIDELLSRLKITSSMSAQDAMKFREIIGAALDKKKLEEAEGILVRKDKVEKALFILGNELKKALFNMPQRIIRDIMSATNEVEAMNIFNQELTIVLNAYANMKLPQLN